MQRDPALARWVAMGPPVSGPDVLGVGAPATPQSRFAELERQVMARTNGLRPQSDLVQPPWPTWLGTPPWGARVELENGAATPGTEYGLVMLRHRGSRGIDAVYRRLLGSIGPGRPALLYVGSATLPRHVTLVFGGGNDAPLVYEPAAGQVRVLSRRDLATRRLDLAGWDRPWWLVQPLPQRTAPARLGVARRRLAPGRVVPEGYWSRDPVRMSGDQPPRVAARATLRTSS